MASTALTKLDTFPWTEKRTQAAQLVAEDRLSDVEIASTLGVARATLANWKGHPLFAARVDQIVERQQRALERKGIADKQRRLDILNDEAAAILTVFQERAEHAKDDFWMQQVPGAETGRVVVEFKPVPGRGFVPEHKIDTGSQAELRATLKQAAIEVGQWTEKKEVGMDPDKPLVIEFRVDGPTPKRLKA